MSSTIKHWANTIPAYFVITDKETQLNKPQLKKRVNSIPAYSSFKDSDTNNKIVLWQLVSWSVTTRGDY